MRKTAATLLLLSIACGPSVTNKSITTSLTPSDAYSCVLRELARRDYAVVTAERDAGLIRAEKKTSGTGTALLSGASYYSDINALVLSDNGATTLKLTVGRSKQQGSGNRSSTGLIIPKALTLEADSIQAACVAD